MIDNAAGNGYLSSDLECPGLKHNGYFVFVLCGDLSELSGEEKAARCSVSGVSCGCFSITWLLMNLGSESYAIAHSPWQCAPDSFVKFF